MTNGNWPYDAIFPPPQPGMLKATHTTYKKREDGRIEVSTVTRTYYGSDDYIDSVSTEILG